MPCLMDHYSLAFLCKLCYSTICKFFTRDPKDANFAIVTLLSPQYEWVYWTGDMPAHSVWTTTRQGLVRLILSHWLLAFLPLLLSLVLPALPFLSLTFLPFSLSFLTRVSHSQSLVPCCMYLPSPLPLSPCLHITLNLTPSPPSSHTLFLFYSHLSLSLSYILLRLPPPPPSLPPSLRNSST